MLLLSVSVSILWITVPQYPIQWIVYVFREVAYEPLACIRCWFRNILTTLNVKKSFFNQIWMRAYRWKKRKISQCCLSLPLSVAKICLQGLIQRSKCKNVYVEGLVQDLSSAGMCSAACTHESPTMCCRREGFAIKSCSRGPESCPGQRLERRPFTQVVADTVLSLVVVMG